MKEAMLYAKNLTISHMSKKRMRKKAQRHDPPKGSCKPGKAIIDGNGNIAGYRCQCFSSNNFGHPVIINGNVPKIDYKKVIRVK